MSDAGDGAVSAAERAELIAACAEACAFSHAPYSNYRVGAALLAVGGSCGSQQQRRIIRGCNVENCAYPDGCCAEKCAVVKAVSEGFTRFAALAVTAATAQGDDFPRMCGSCRQVLAEFCDEQLPIFLVRFSDRSCRTVRLGDLLPGAMRPAVLMRERPT